MLLTPIRLAFLPVLLVLVVHASAAQSGWERYPVRTFDDVLDTLTQDVTNGDTLIQAGAAIAPREILGRIRGTFTGETRPIPPERLAIIHYWLRVQHYAPIYADSFATEGRFLANGAEHWVALRASLLPRLLELPTPTSEIDLYLSVAGGVFAGKRPAGIFVASEFDAVPEADALPRGGANMPHSDQASVATPRPNGSLELTGGRPAYAGPPQPWPPAAHFRR